MDDLRLLLEAEGITFKEDEEFERLLRLFENEISQRIGVPLKPTSRLQVLEGFNDLKLVVDYYPVHSVESLRIGGRSLREDEYILDHDNGLIYLTHEYKGRVELKYSYCITSEQYATLIIPLLLNLFEYHAEEGYMGNATSIKEGDITINLEASKNGLIEKQYDDLRKVFSVMARMI